MLDAPYMSIFQDLQKLHRDNFESGKMLSKTDFFAFHNRIKKEFFHQRSLDKQEEGKLRVNKQQAELLKGMLTNMDSPERNPKKAFESFNKVVQLLLKHKAVFAEKDKTLPQSAQLAVEAMRYLDLSEYRKKSSLSLLAITRHELFNLLFDIRKTQPQPPGFWEGSLTLWMGALNVLIQTDSQRAFAFSKALTKVYSVPDVFAKNVDMREIDNEHAFRLMELSILIHSLEGKNPLASHYHEHQIQLAKSLFELHQHNQKNHIVASMNFGQEDIRDARVIIEGTRSLLVSERAQLASGALHLRREEQEAPSSPIATSDLMKEHSTPSKPKNEGSPSQKQKNNSPVNRCLFK